MSRRARDKSSIGLFPFLAVLICTMGALILVLLSMTGKLQQQMAAKARAREAAILLAINKAPPAPDPVAEPDPEPVPELPPSIPAPDYSAQREEIEAERERRLQAWEKLIREKALQKELRRQQLADHEQELNDAKRALTQTEAVLTDLTGRVKSVSAEDQKLDQTMDGLHDRRNDAEQMVLKARKNLEDVRRRKSAASNEFAVIPYDGSSGTYRRPIYIECTAAGIRFLPEGQFLPIGDLEGFTQGYNPLLIGAQALAEYWSQKNKADPDHNPPPYVLLLVRPSGAATYYGARMLLSKLDTPFGYELLDDSFKLSLQEGDPVAARLLNVAVADTMRTKKTLDPSFERGTLPDGTPSESEDGFTSMQGRGRSPGSPGAPGSNSGRPARLGNGQSSNPGKRLPELTDDQVASADQSYGEGTYAGNSGVRGGTGNGGGAASGAGGTRGGRGGVGGSGSTAGVTRGKPRAAGLGLSDHANEDSEGEPGRGEHRSGSGAGGSQSGAGADQGTGAGSGRRGGTGPSRSGTEPRRLPSLVDTSEEDELERTLLGDAEEQLGDGESGSGVADHAIGNAAGKGSGRSGRLGTASGTSGGTGGTGGGSLEDTLDAEDQLDIGQSENARQQNLRSGTGQRGTGVVGSGQPGNGSTGSGQPGSGQPGNRTRTGLSSSAQGAAGNGQSGRGQSGGGQSTGGGTGDGQTGGVAVVMGDPGDGNSLGGPGGGQPGAGMEPLPEKREGWKTRQAPGSEPQEPLFGDSPHLPAGQPHDDAPSGLQRNASRRQVLGSRSSAGDGGDEFGRSGRTGGGGDARAVRWGGMRNTIGLEQDVRADVYPDRIVIGADRAALGIKLGENREELAERVANRLDDIVQGWGEAPQRFHWIPRLRFVVHPGGNQHYLKLQTQLRDWGISQTVDYSIEPANAGTNKSDAKPVKPKTKKTTQQLPKTLR